jgi:propionate CoA-transferase
VYVIVNYDGFQIDESLEGTYLDDIKKMTNLYYHSVTRFATNAFQRSRLGVALEDSGIDPHMYESEEKAEAALLDGNSQRE